MIKLLRRKIITVNDPHCLHFNLYWTRCNKQTTVRHLNTADKEFSLLEVNSNSIVPTRAVRAFVHSIKQHCSSLVVSHMFYNVLFLFLLQVIICTDGQANIGLGHLEQESSRCSDPSPYFYNQLAHYAAEKGWEHKSLSEDHVSFYI